VYARAPASVTRVHVCARARAAPRRIPPPPLFLLHHPLSLLFCLCLSCSIPPGTVFNDVAGIISAIRAAASALAKSGASQRRTKRAACAAGDLPERSLRGGSARRRGSGGGVRRGRGFPAPRRDSLHEGGRKAARCRRSKPLEPVLREFFYVGPWFSSRRRTRRPARFSSRTILPLRFGCFANISDTPRLLGINRAKASSSLASPTRISFEDRRDAERFRILPSLPPSLPSSLPPSSPSDFPRRCDLFLEHIYLFDLARAERVLSVALSNLSSFSPRLSSRPAASPLRGRVSRVTIATIGLKCACDVTCHNLNGTRVIKRHNDPLRVHPCASQLRGRTRPTRAGVGSKRDRERERERERDFFFSLLSTAVVSRVYVCNGIASR